MILKFKFKDDYWDRNAFAGANYFIKDPTSGEYVNFGIGELRKFKSEGGSRFSEKVIGELLRRRNIEVLEEYEQDNDQQGELLTEGNTEIPSS